MFESSTLFRELSRRKVIRTGAAYLVVAWLVVQVADILLEAFAAPEWAMRGLVIALALGFFVTVVLSWIYDVTARGVERTVDESVGRRPEGRGRQIDFAIIGALVVALGVFAADRFEWLGTDPSPVVEEPSIAVLPFGIVSADPNSEHFADAITEELIARLGRIDGVRIKSRLSVARFRGSGQDAGDVADALGVNLIVEGTVRKSGDRVRVTAQLTDATSGFQQWSDVFDGESDDWFALHEDLATRIANALDLQVSPQTAAAFASHSTENPEAYDAFWRGWLLLESFHVDVTHPAAKASAAEGHFLRALEIDPDYPLAIAGLSLVNSYRWSYGVDNDASRNDEAMVLARRALEIDPDLHEGHVALGMALGNANDNAAANEVFREALAKYPEDAMTWCLLAYSCIAQVPPDLDAAEEAARVSLEHDPTWTYSYQILGWALSLKGQYAESAAAYETATELNPDYFDAQFGLGGARLAQGDFAAALAAFEIARSIWPREDVFINLAATQAGLGDLDAAFDNLEKGLDAGFDYFDALDGSAYFESLRADPRFTALIDDYR